MNKCLLYVIATFLLLFTVTPLSAERTGKPNFVFLLVDDFSWGDLGCYGNDFHETPNIDGLCKSGMKFNHAYAAGMICSPSRGAILTGQYPARTGLTDWLPGSPFPHTKLTAPDWTKKIEYEKVTLPEALKEAGYATGFFGKWHLGNPSYRGGKHGPEHHGFDFNVGGTSAGLPIGGYFHPFNKMPNLEGSKEGDYLTDHLTDKAIDFIEESKDKPFLLYFSYYTVHFPVESKPEYQKKYEEKQKQSKGKFAKKDPALAGMVQSLDESVGRIQQKLKELDLDDNTIIIFTSDNGGDSNNRAGELRGLKGLSFEGGNRVPFIVKWPGTVKPGSQCDVPVIGNDIYPTILDMAGLPLKPKEHIDGLSIAPLLKQTGSIDRDTLYWHYPHYHRTLPYGSIRSKGWKLIEFFETGQLMLFNLNDDPGEKNDLATKMPEKTAELLRNLKQWRQEVGAKMMSSNSAYDPRCPNNGKEFDWDSVTGTIKKGLWQKKLKEAREKAKEEARKKVKK